LAVAEEAVKTGVAHQDLTLEIITEKVKNNLSKK